MNCNTTHYRANSSSVPGDPTFDNGCHRREAPSFSQIVEVDPETHKVEWSYSATPILAFFSFMISSCQRLPDGNTFVTEGATGRIFEITPEGETVWEYVSPWMVPSRFGPSTAVFRAYRIAKGDPRLAGLELKPTPYKSFNDRIAANKILTDKDERLPRPRAAKKAATKQTPAKRAPAKKAAAKKRAPRR